MANKKKKLSSKKCSSTGVADSRGSHGAVEDPTGSGADPPGSGADPPGWVADSSVAAPDPPVSASDQPASGSSPPKAILSRDSPEAKGASSSSLVRLASFGAPSSPDLEAPPQTSPQPEPTWCEVLSGGSKALSKCGSPFNLETGERCVTIPNQIIEESKSLWKDFVIGQFYHGAPSFGKIRAVVNLMWSKWHRDITVTKLETENTFLFRIPNISARKRVLQEAIWSIDGSTMFVANWTPGFTPTKPALKTAPVWIELRQVPLEFYNPKSLSHIASLVGHPICLHKETIAMTNFEVAKVFTEINLSQPLPETVCARFESGEIRRVEVSCPHLPPICKLCNEAGHTSKRCPKAPPLCPMCKKAFHDSAICPLAKEEKSHVAIIPLSSNKSKVVPKTKYVAKATATSYVSKDPPEQAQPCTELSTQQDSGKRDEHTIKVVGTVVMQSKSQEEPGTSLTPLIPPPPQEEIKIVDKGKQIVVDPGDVVDDFTVFYSKMTKKKQRRSKNLGIFPISRVFMGGNPLRKY